MQQQLDFDQRPLPERVFLGWDSPLLESVTAWLLADNGADLANTAVVVPTSNSGRRLRMALSADGGLLAPHVLPPSRLFQVDGVASRQESLWAWVNVIRGIDFGEFAHLFRNRDPDAKAGFKVALALAREFLQLREDLAEGDASFRDAEYHSVEKERWAELGKLEGLMLKQLGKWGLHDPVRAKRDQAKAPELPASVSRVVVACVPDPTPLALRALESLLASGVQVTVLIHAPEPESESFSPWGIPLAESWTKREIDIAQWRQRLHVVDSPADLATLCTGVLAEAQTPAENVALALCDATFEPALDKAFTEAGWPLYNPEGSGLADSGIVALLHAMRDLSNRDRPFDALRELVRLPGSEMFLPANTNRHRAAIIMDELHTEHLPETISGARFPASAEQREVLDAISLHLDELGRGGLCRTLRNWLDQWLAQSDPSVARAAEAPLAEAMDALERLESLEEKEAAPVADEAFDMLAESLRPARVPQERHHTVLDLQGWLEISYDPAPHLVLAGMHEECLPDGVVDDIFVPDTMRQQLGLRSVEERFARDAFLLQSAVASRGDHGRVDAVVARFNDAGDARTPSRLLMRQSGESLADIVGHLFDETPSATPVRGAWERDWVLRKPELANPYNPDDDQPPRRLSPSAIKDYLDCPLRFYLKRILKMESYDAGKREMDALDFGNLCHQVLEQFGNDETIRNSADPKEIEGYFMEGLDQEMRRVYGNDLSLPLMIQLDSARERLRAFASIQAADRDRGWQIMATEFRVGLDETPWEIAGHPIWMAIDRIDHNEDSGQWRIWDYKTSGKAKKPEDAHQATWNEAENRPLLGELIPAQGQKKERRWAEVQLPMYAAFVQQHFNTGDLPQVGYINLPRAVSDVAFCPWLHFDQSVMDHAMSWAEAAVEKIRAGEFDQAAVYPAGERRWDSYEELAPDGLAAAFGL